MRRMASSGSESAPTFVRAENGGIAPKTSVIVSLANLPHARVWPMLITICRSMSDIDRRKGWVWNATQIDRFGRFGLKRNSSEWHGFLGQVSGEFNPVGWCVMFDQLKFAFDRCDLVLYNSKNKLSNNYAIVKFDGGVGVRRWGNNSDTCPSYLRLSYTWTFYLSRIRIVIDKLPRGNIGGPDKKKGFRGAFFVGSGRPVTLLVTWFRVPKPHTHVRIVRIFGYMHILIRPLCWHTNVENEPCEGNCTK